jgi:hypothetical protein
MEPYMLQSKALGMMRLNLEDLLHVQVLLLPSRTRVQLLQSWRALKLSCISPY